jgi:TRAP-type C4-dicarboxylate transport system substrate-binding protein
MIDRLCNKWNGILAACSAAILFAASPASAATYTLKGATATNDTTALGKVGQYFKEIVEKKSNGEIEVRWFGNGQLGGEAALLNQLNDGVLQFATLSTAVSSSLNPKLDVLYLPYFLPDPWVTFETKFATSAAAKELLGALSKQGIEGQAFIPYGVDALAYKGSPVRSPEEAKGKKLRSAESVNIRTTLEAMGFNAVPLPWTEAYQSIQTKVVDGLSTPPMMVKQARFYEVVDNMTISGHLFGVHVFWLREDAIAKMPENLKAIVRSSAKEASERAAKELNSMEASIIAELEKGGMKVWRLSDAERERFVKATVPVVRNYEQRIDKSSGDGKAFMRRMYEATGQNYDKVVGP